MNEQRKQLAEAFQSAQTYFQSNKWKKVGSSTGKSFASLCFKIASIKSGIPIYCGRTFFGRPFHGISGCAISKGIAGCGYFEAELTEFLIEDLKAGDVFIDVGCHLGYYTMLASELVGPTGAVLSIDPLDSISRQRRRNISNLENVEFIAAALGNAEGFATLSTFGGGLEAFATLQNARLDFIPEKVEKSKVKVVRLDRLVERANIAPSHIKIDAEGSELNVLQGAKHVLGDLSPLVVCEVGDLAINSEGSTKAIIAELSYYGYRAYTLGPNGLQRLVERDKYLEPLNFIFTKPNRGR